MARAWDKEIPLEIQAPGNNKSEVIRLTIKEGVEVLAEQATVGSDRLIMKAFLAIMEEIEQLDAKNRIRLKGRTSFMSLLDKQ